MSTGFKELKVYKESYQLAMEIHELTKKFPSEEKFSLNDQIRRSSRAVCALIGEGYRKRKHPKLFSLMIVDADAEASETTVHLDFALDCGYLTNDVHSNLLRRYDEIGRMLGSMSNHPEKFTPKNQIK